MNTKPRGYTLIEPPVYQLPGWDNDLIVQFMAYYCTRLDDVFPEYMGIAEYDLLSVGNPHGGPFPAIGLYLADDDTSVDFFELEERVEADLDGIEAEQLKTMCKSTSSPTWEELKKIVCIPHLNKKREQTRIDLRT